MYSNRFFFSVASTVLLFFSIAVASGNPLSDLLSGDSSSSEDSKEQEGEDVAASEKPGAIGIKEVLESANSILRQSEQTKKDISVFTPGEEFSSQLEKIAVSVRKTMNQSQAIQMNGYLSSEGLSELRSNVDGINLRISSAEDVLNTMIEKGDALHRSWKGKKKAWEKSIKSLSDNAARNAAGDKIREVDIAIGSTLKKIDQSIADIILVKQRLETIADSFADLRESVEIQWKRFKDSLWERNAENLFSADSLFLEGSLQSWQNKIQSRPLFNKLIWAEHRVLFILQTLFMLVIWMVLINLGKTKISYEAKYPLLKLGPVLSFILIFTLPNLYVFRSAPNDLFLGVAGFLSFVSLFIIADAVLVERSWKLAFKVFSILLLLHKTIQFLEIPAGISRVYLFTVSVGIMVYFAFKTRNLSHHGWQYQALVLVGLLFGGLVGGTQVFGFVNLSFHLFEATCLSITLLLFAVMFNRIIEDTLTSLIAYVIAPRSKFFSHYKERATKTFHRVFNVLTFVFGFIVVVKIWDLSEHPLSVLEDFFSMGFEVGETRYSVGVLVTGALVFYGFIKASQFTQVFLKEEIYPRKGVESGTGVAINRLVHYFVLVVGVLVFCSIIGFQLQNIAFIGGAIGIGIGFGLQTIINNFVSGLILLLERSIKVGDTVIIDNKWGNIRKIGLRATVLETWEKSEVTVPNSLLVAESVTNWTLSNRGARVDATIGVAYGSNADQVKEILLDIADTHPRVVKSPEPLVLFTGFGDSSLDFILRVWIFNVDEKFVVLSDINFAIEKALREANITIPFPQRDVHLHTIEKTIQAPADLVKE